MRWPLKIAKGHGMILYTLHNSTFQLEVYEDRLVYRPRLWLRALGGKSWQVPQTIHFSRLTRVELQIRLWPLRHDLCVHTCDQILHFRFRAALPFFQRLAPYLERQMEKYRNHPEAFPAPVKTVLDLVEEKRKKALKEFLRAG